MMRVVTFEGQDWAKRSWMASSAVLSAFPERSSPSINSYPPVAKFPLKEFG